MGDHPRESTDRKARPIPETWQDISWLEFTDQVTRLQGRIFRAAKAGDHRKVRDLQLLMIRSRSALALAIRQVTQINQGRATAGVDGVVVRTDRQRMELLGQGIDLEGYRPKPVRRVYIPKANGKLRPLGIPTVKDRIVQAVVKLALEPEWESRFEANSYGFRPGRSAHDAMQAIWIGLNQDGASEWIVDADISGCFDNIDHQALLSRIAPHFHEVVRRWLCAGVVELSNLKETTAGTPQGGIISPLLANIALDGMERLFGGETKDGRPKMASKKKGPNHGVHLIRYADDFVVFCPSRDVAEQHVLPKLESFLAERGLQLSEAKTRLAHVEEGFNFLGFTTRRLGGKLIVKPQKEKVTGHIRRLSEHFRAHRQQPTAGVIRDLSPVIRGWASYYRHVVSKRVFAKVDDAMWPMIFKWVKRRHPTKSIGWVKARYFTLGSTGRRWTLSTGPLVLPKHDATPIVRWVKVSGRASPLDPDLRSYWAIRRKTGRFRQTSSALTA
jgi:RNA-directed DNA polymerase